MRARRVAAPACASAIALAACGCAEYRVYSEHEDPVRNDYESQTLHSMFWGLGDQPTIETDHRYGYDDVVVHDNFLYDVVSVITLGIWKPIEVRYRERAPQGAPPRPGDQPPVLGQADPSGEG